MRSADERNTPAKAKAALIDPESMTVVWTNEPDSQPGAPIDQVVPMAEALGLPEALRAVADTGVSQHLRAELINTAKGSMGMVVSIYRLPDGKLLMLTENAWRVGHPATGGSASRRSGRRAR